LPDDRAAQTPVKIYIKTVIHHPEQQVTEDQANEFEKDHLYRANSEAELTSSSSPTMSSQASTAPETYELITFGQYQETQTAAYLRYQEVLEVGTVNTTVKITNDEMLILRSGALKMRMVFRPGKPVSGTYHSPHGFMEIVTEAQNFTHHHNHKSNEGHITLKYDLSMQETLAGTYHLDIKYEEERK